MKLILLSALTILFATGCATNGAHVGDVGKFQKDSQEAPVDTTRRTFASAAQENHQSPIEITRGARCTAHQTDCATSLQVAGALIWGRYLDFGDVDIITCDSIEDGKYERMACSVSRSAVTKHCPQQTNFINVLVPKLKSYESSASILVPSIDSETGFKCRKNESN